MKSHAKLRGWALAASLVLLAGPGQGQLAPNPLPLRIGADQAGGMVWGPGGSVVLNGQLAEVAK